MSNVLTSLRAVFVEELLPTLVVQELNLDRAVRLPLLSIDFFIKVGSAQGTLDGIFR